MTSCLNGGSCVPDERKETFSCSCKLPWTGEKCETKIGKELQICTNVVWSCLHIARLSKIWFRLLGSKFKINVLKQKMLEMAEGLQKALD